MRNSCSSPRSVSAQTHRGPEAPVPRSDRWVYLGQRFVDGRVDSDKLPVSVGGGFRAIQLRVSGSPVEFRRVVVHFENGEDTQVDVRNDIPPGGMTRAIDLPGNRRRIRSVQMWYSKARWRHRPGVKVYGLR